VLLLRWKHGAVHGLPMQRINLSSNPANMEQNRCSRSGWEAFVFHAKLEDGSALKT